ncbi:MAG: alpha/beta hydrolase [Rhodobacteraceae bacterium]|nr:alpha/beta hydrolase [Paracoccaceae bacterium]
MDIDRAFVRVREGLVHYRSCGTTKPAAPLPLYMIHASPASSLNLVPMMLEFGKTRACIAPDTLGNGDSAPSALDAPDMDYYADSVARVLDALKLDKVDVYGSHTGAHIACELAIRFPDRVRKVVFDGIGMFSPEDKKDFLANYAPEIHPEEFGQHLIWAWNFVRDQVLYFPYFRRTPEFARQQKMASPEAIQSIVLEVLKSLTTYHRGYRAAFRHPDRERIPLIPCPLLVMASEDDPLYVTCEEAAALAKHGTKMLLPSERNPEGRAKKAKAVIDWLDA